MLNGDQNGGKKTSSFDTFQVKAISKAFPSATHINLQNAITGTLGCVLLLWYFQRKKTGGNVNVSFSSIQSVNFPFGFLSGKSNQMSFKSK